VRAVVAGSGGAPGSGAGYLHMQAQKAASEFAEARGQSLGPEHLLIALLDHGTQEVLEALSQAGLDRATVRRSALSGIGAPADHPPLGIPAPVPAGTMDRPPLPVDDLDQRAWAVLRWRQDHLPLARLRRAGDREALARLERAAAWGVADRLRLGDDQRYSLIRHHDDAVTQAIAREAGVVAPGGPGLAGLRGAADSRARGAPGLGPHGGPAVHARRVALLHRRLGRYGLPGTAVLNLTVGWGAWLRNRRNSLDDRWVWLRTLRDYRGCPEP
jgi:Clp amino terminal domain, pathogenicity island component